MQLGTLLIGLLCGWIIRGWAIRYMASLERRRALREFCDLVAAAQAVERLGRTKPTFSEN